MENVLGTVFNIQRYSIDDGPGVRTTVFLKGCPLACPWCSNPESQSPAPMVTYRYTACKRCGTCAEVCPEGVITLDDDGIHIDREKCTLCEACIRACIPEALALSGRRMAPEEAFKTVRRDKDYYEPSGGGVTCSGGELLGQPDFVAALFRLCRDEGIGTCADTCGFGTAAALETILPYTDLFLFDLKHAEDAAHQRFCGVSNTLILENLRRVAESGVPYIIRIPLIPGFNDGDEALTEMAELVTGLPNRPPVNLLPYHRYGANKYRMIDMVYTMEAAAELTEAQKTRAKEVFESRGLQCTVSK